MHMLHIMYVVNLVCLARSNNTKWLLFIGNRGKKVKMIFSRWHGRESIRI